MKTELLKGLVLVDRKRNNKSLITDFVDNDFKKYTSSLLSLYGF